MKTKLLLGLGALVVLFWASHLAFGLLAGLVALLVSVLAPALLIMAALYGAYRILF